DAEGDRGWPGPGRGVAPWPGPLSQPAGWGLGPHDAAADSAQPSPPLTIDQPGPSMGAGGRAGQGACNERWLARCNATPLEDVEEHQGDTLTLRNSTARVHGHVLIDCFDDLQLVDDGPNEGQMRDRPGFQPEI